MRVLMAMMMHETNTFSPVPTDLQRFALTQGGTPPVGQEAVQAFRGTGMALAAYIDEVEQLGWAYDVALAAHAAPSGVVQTEAFETMCQTIVQAVASQPYDAVLLDLHGAMVTAEHDDGEGELLRRIRAVAPQVPVAVAYDMHANIYADMVELAQAVAGYQTYPHVDAYQTGQRAARAVLGMVQGKTKPTSAWGRVPMIPHVMRQSSEDEPNRSLQARARAMEQQGALCASVFTGFPHADIEGAGLSVVVVTDNDPALAAQWRDELLAMAWAQRAAFVYEIEPLAQAVARAASLKPSGPGPIVLLDHYDNTASGGTMDATRVLAEIMAQGLQDVAAFAIYDPQAVAQCMQAGVGAQVKLSVGGKLAMTQVPHAHPALPLEGVVKTLSFGRYLAKGPMSKGARQDMGHAAVVDTGAVEVVLISRHVEPFDVNALLSVGIDPMQKRFVMLKSRVHWRAGLGQLAAATVDCAGNGVCTSDYSDLTFHRLRRPIYPLDPLTEWQP
ncbi:MAG: M81 family metallopeptidase [Burkholderiaceae bacterium]